MSFYSTSHAAHTAASVGVWYVVLQCKSHSTHCSICRRLVCRQSVYRWLFSFYCQYVLNMFYLTMHSTRFIYGYMASDIWLRTILIVRKETCCRHIGYSYRLTARVLLYAPSHRQDNTYHGLCYTSRGALAGMRNSSMDHFTMLDDNPIMVVICKYITGESIVKL